MINDAREINRHQIFQTFTVKIGSFSFILRDRWECHEICNSEILDYREWLETVTLMVPLRDNGTRV